MICGTVFTGRIKSGPNGWQCGFLIPPLPNYGYGTAEKKKDERLSVNRLRIRRKKELMQQLGNNNPDGTTNSAYVFSYNISIFWGVGGESGVVSFQWRNTNG